MIESIVILPRIFADKYFVPLYVIFICLLLCIWIIRSYVNSYIFFLASNDHNQISIRLHNVWIIKALDMFEYNFKESCNSTCQKNCEIKKSSQHLYCEMWSMMCCNYRNTVDDLILISSYNYYHYCMIDAKMIKIFFLK